mgnify:CR=1 FL=1
MFLSFEQALGTKRARDLVGYLSLIIWSFSLLASFHWPGFWYLPAMFASLFVALGTIIWSERISEGQMTWRTRAYCLFLIFGGLLIGAILGAFVLVWPYAWGLSWSS